MYGRWKLLQNFILGEMLLLIRTSRKHESHIIHRNTTEIQSEPSHIADKDINCALKVK